MGIWWIEEAELIDSAIGYCSAAEVFKNSITVGFSMETFHTVCRYVYSIFV